MISLTTDYAIRALVLLAAAGKLMMVKDVARECEIPYHFLAKILQNLARRGWLHSTKGPKGGFGLRVHAHDLTIAEIVFALDGQRVLSPYIGQKAMEAMNRYQEKTTIADLARQKRRAA
jgi:Rrf2 family iron-sulfur cluster assembly transcriptional regulator